MERDLPWSSKPLIMGVLNVTPDSFFDGGKHSAEEDAVRHALLMVESGAHIIDVGGESSRPFSSPVSTDEELRRIIPVIQRIRAESDVPISVDTCKARVAREACLAGADIVNDISGLRNDPDMADAIRDLARYVVIMHMKGAPADMQKAPYYDDVVTEIRTFFLERMRYAVDSGIEEEKIILDPGIGFGKRLEDNLKILKALDRFAAIGRPLLVGTSMKGFIGTITGSSLEERIEGTLASIAIAIWNGAAIVRVHDVKRTSKVVKLVDAIKKA
ncbi:dihydropteroate synthase [Syntrophorhabdus aromaticivorans]|jgi:dihydropteroate synthase|uniref:Dihydropteroate synthase n=1 Tax=Syntrophorhabdus aromaticivorans TaxID=328301 RepID=A0A971M3T9_9BACT|nr:dihydropteroate synthase [Syntrophorhabdus aromaticivorans]NLW35243.1 dihydropteroate synthase [Syntrophorhabdus aromaticivorans]